MTDELTPEQWLDKLAPFDQWNERILMALFATYGIPSSMLDVGCGTSAMVNLARRIGVDALGVDQIAREPDVEHDLRTPFNLGKTYALVMCIEVAEHIPEEDSGVFLQNAISHLVRGGRFIFSAAPPGQLGEGHVNLKPAKYWRDQIHKHGLNYGDELTIRLRLAWQWVPMPMQWILGNLQVFMRE